MPAHALPAPPRVRAKEEPVLVPQPVVKLLFTEDPVLGDLLPGDACGPATKRNKGALSKDVQELLGTICDAAAMKREAEEAGYDCNRLPLENVTKGIVKEGFSTLNAIEQALQASVPTLELSRAFFAAVPCQDATDQPAIDSPARLQEKLALVQLLADIEPVYSALLKLALTKKRRRVSLSVASPRSAGPEAEALGPNAPRRGAAPKRPPSPFFMFLSETRGAIAKELGQDMAFGADAKRAAEVWRALTSKQRRAYKNRYKASKEEYDKEQRELKEEEVALLSAGSIVRKRYRFLQCDIELLPVGSGTWMLIHEYVRSTQPPGPHALRVLRVFAVSRHGEDERYATHARDPNRMLLWHCSRQAGLATVLLQGLRAAPRDSPSTARSFGRGLYFTDAIGRAVVAQGVVAEASSGRRGLLVLAEVALGACREALRPEPGRERAPAGYDSTLGPGSLAPDPANSRELPDGVRVPLGPAVQQQASAGRPPHGEYVVYGAARARLRYLVEVRAVPASEVATLDAAASRALAARGARRLRAKTAAALAAWAGA